MAGQLQEETGWWEEGSSLDSWASEGKGLIPTQSGTLPAPPHISLEGELAISLSLCFVVWKTRIGVASITGFC